VVEKEAGVAGAEAANLPATSPTMSVVPLMRSAPSLSSSGVSLSMWNRASGPSVLEALAVSRHRRVLGPIASNQA
jgi:hypothetical protein